MRLAQGMRSPIGMASLRWTPRARTKELVVLFSCCIQAASWRGPPWPKCRNLQHITVAYGGCLRSLVQNIATCIEMCTWMHMLYTYTWYTNTSICRIHPYTSIYKYGCHHSSHARWGSLDFIRVAFSFFSFFSSSSSTMSSRDQWALLDLNCERHDLNRKCQISVGTARPQPRMPDRMPE